MKEYSHIIGAGDLFKSEDRCWVLLASKSPRRIELMKFMGIKNLYICESGFEENLDKHIFSCAEDYVKENALNKGLNVVEHVWFSNNTETEDITSNGIKDLDIKVKRENNSNHSNDYSKYEIMNINSKFEPLPKIIISCDTIVTLNNEIIEKPVNKQHAHDILKKLSSNVHSVFTAVCIFLYKKKIPITFIEKTQVYFDDLMEEDILQYINTKEPYDKAGAYSIQGVGSQFIKKIDGCYYNVMGLPINKLSKFLTKLYIDEEFSV
ncbi:septum formation protein MAF homologue, putative [Plasmodium reichenowi]|uniref:Septum formation protein MAF homologue, putative n=1 Tax=Plasmodium reichenowi TaxID=5854 RepID=A0A2P9DL82_PLARE|nr:septum formation protein MAF homologue, putative [Plasmodium reichenowi]